MFSTFLLAKADSLAGRSTGVMSALLMREREGELEAELFYESGMARRGE